MSHYNGGVNIELTASRHNGSLPNLLSYENESLDKDDFDGDYLELNQGGETSPNGFIQNGHEHISVFPVVLELTDDERRFGFSVVGGVDEGFRPRIDEVVEDLPAERMGVKVGDEIEKVNEKSIRYSTHAQIVTTIHESVRKGQITLTLRRRNALINDTASTLPLRGRSANRNNNIHEVHANLSDTTKTKLENIIRHQSRQPQAYTDGPSTQGAVSSQGAVSTQGTLPGQGSISSRAAVSSRDDDTMVVTSHRRPGRNSPQTKTSPDGSYTSGSTLSLNRHGNGAVSKTVDPPFMGMDNYGYDWRHSHYNTSAPEYNEAIHGPSRISYLSSVTSDEGGVPMMDSRDCQAVVSAVMRYAHAESDDELLVDLRILEAALHTKHFQNALKVQCKIVELENQGRGPHFVNAERDDVAAIASQISTFIDNQRSGSREAMELLGILNSPVMREFLIAHDRAAKIDRPNFTENDSPVIFERNDSVRISNDRISTDRMSNDRVSSDRTSNDRVSNDDEDQMKIVKIDKGDEPLGATVRNEGTAVVIGRIVNGGAAQKSGLLHEGDEIVEINGVNMRGKTVEEVCELLADMNGMLTFLLKPSNKTQHHLFASAELHVRALFDYDPNDDEYLPCRELGLQFSRRDVLHIVNQDDPNWWQAWREGTSGNELAGLIPAKNFQKQREELKMKGKNKKKGKSTTCGCFGKSKDKKSKSLDNGDEAYTYEEVGLYQPDRNRKRPIVLIGPTKIGRRELRQRLLQVAPERFGSAVPHTSRRQKPEEVNGKEYYFITKNHFKEYVANGKFVEHGEYDGHYYGTSLEAIREIVDSGKVCVVNLHCQALKILRDSLLKPYVIFISPPTVEKIKRLRRGNIDAFNPNAKLSGDEELEEIVTSAQEMEDDYGHCFDKIIVNTDLERTFDELIKAINELEARRQWIPVKWMRQT